MTRNMFDDVIGPSITVGGKRRLTVPLSIAAHTIVIAALIMIPLLAVDSSFLPAPPAMMSFIHVEARLPPPPSAPPAHSSPSAKPVVTANPDAAPLEAPSTVAPEHEVQPPRGLIGTVEGSMGVVLAGVL